MNKQQQALAIKIGSIILTVIMVVTFYLFFARKISVYVFWLVVIVCAVAAYWVIPKLRKNLEGS